MKKSLVIKRTGIKEHTSSGKYENTENNSIQDRRKQQGRISFRLLWSYLVIILAPAVAILIIYNTMQDALLDVQQEKAINLQTESISTFNRELDQIVHVLSRIAEDEDVKQYMEASGTLSGSSEYYVGYQLAVNYPDYRLTNRFIQNIYMFPTEGAYVIQLPAVLPNTSRGINTMSAFSDAQDYSELLDRLNGLNQLQSEGIFWLDNSDGSTNLLMFREVAAEKSGQRLGYVIVELDQSMVRDLLRQTLSGDPGAAFLTDADGKLLLVCDNLEGEEVGAASGYTWEEYLRDKGWAERKLTFVTGNLDYNQWKFVTAVPDSAMANRIGDIRYFIMILCGLSILIGIAICMRYWRSSWPVVKKYEKLGEQYQTGGLNGGMDGVWKRLGGVMDRMEELQKTVEQQAEWAKEGILRKILYGSYDTAEELQEEADKTGIEVPVDVPCLVAVMKVGDPMEQGVSMSEDEIGNCLKEHIGKYLPYQYRMINTEPMTYTLVLMEQTDGRKAKEIFEEINYGFYSGIPLNIYMGISQAAEDLMEISSEYENACTCCEYASYHKIRIPLLPEDIPERRHMVFTVDMEIQLEKTIRNGSREQLEQFMDQIRENFWQRGRQRRHNIEVVRCIALRCLDEEPDSEELHQLQEKIRCTDNPEGMRECIFCVRDYFEQQRSQDDDQEQIRLKSRLEGKIQEEYPRQDFNLAFLADWAGIPEKKLYRDFKKMFGVSFSSYLEMLRLRQAQKLLQEGRPVQDVAAAVGYSSDYSFRRAFKRVVGVSPSNYQKLQ